MASFEDIEEQVKDWISNHVKDSKEALGLSGMVMFIFNKYRIGQRKRWATGGFVSGIIFTIIILKWLS